VIDERSVNRAERLTLVLAGALVVLGVAVAFLPKDWIEETVAFEPDAGNGIVELAIVLVPIVIGIALAVRVWLAVRARATKGQIAKGGFDG
jgi:apolipoprotein N-acyltransferase